MVKVLFIGGNELTKNKFSEASKLNNLAFIPFPTSSPIDPMLVYLESDWILVAPYAAHDELYTQMRLRNIPIPAGFFVQYEGNTEITTSLEFLSMQKDASLVQTALQLCEVARAA